MRLSNLNLTLLFDNMAGNPDLHCLWGFACLVQVPDFRLLFDTGSNGRLLLQNMNRLGLEPTDIDFLFISHTHWDHIGGLDSVLELNPDLHLLIPDGTSPRMVETLRALCRAVTLVGEGPSEFAPALASTGSFPGDPPEHALVITTDAGAVVITGCAHPGILEIADVATQQTGKNIALLAGGFHLFQASAESVSRTAEKLLSLGIRHIMPTHCTGVSAMQILQEQFGQRFITCGLGQTIGFDTEDRLVLPRPGSSSV
jgi:7,8-dihydropterin-6-yl-methyl-4-(beta-D-ribofuranosyl)aminobenzene 5'-phosphate synthase